MSGSSRGMRTSVIETLEGRRFLSVSVGTVPSPSSGGSGTGVVGNHVIASGVLFRAEAGESQTPQVGILSGVRGVAANFSNLHASIDWGDGSNVSTGTFWRDATGRIHISGTHTYAAAGQDHITVDVWMSPATPPGGPQPLVAIQVATIHSTALVRPDTEGGATLTEVATRPFTAKLGTFDFANVDTQLRATINWGDGTASTTGRIVRVGFDDWAVVGSHTYAHTGTYHANVTIFGVPIGFPGPPPVVDPLTSFAATIHVLGRA